MPKQEPGYLQLGSLESEMLSGPAMGHWSTKLDSSSRDNEDVRRVGHAGGGREVLKTGELDFRDVEQLQGVEASGVEVYGEQLCVDYGSS